MPKSWRLEYCDRNFERLGYTRRSCRQKILLIKVKKISVKEFKAVQVSVKDHNMKAHPWQISTPKFTFRLYLPKLPRKLYCIREISLPTVPLFKYLDV